MSIMHAPQQEIELTLHALNAAEPGTAIGIGSHSYRSAPQEVYYLCGHCSIIFESAGTYWILSGRIIRCSNCSRYSVLEYRDAHAGDDA